MKKKKAVAYSNLYLSSQSPRFIPFSPIYCLFLTSSSSSSSPFSSGLLDSQNALNFGTNFPTNL